jgi:hypothetical protein
MDEPKTCYDYTQSIGEECGIDGHEIYHDSEICSSFDKTMEQSGPQIVVFSPWMLEKLGIEIEKDNMDGVKLFETED